MHIIVNPELNKEQAKLALLHSISISEDFTRVFYFLSSLSELYRLGFIDNYTTLPDGSSDIFFTLKDFGYTLTDAEVKELASRSTEWTEERKEKVVKFYKAYHNMIWDMERKCWTKGQ